MGMSAAGVRGLAAGVVLTGATFAAFKSRDGLPPSPDEITPREVLAKAAIPLAVVTGLGAVGSGLNFGSVAGSGSFLGGVALATAGAGLLLGGSSLVNGFLEH